MAGKNRLQLALEVLKEKDGHIMSPDMVMSFIKLKLASSEKTAIEYCHLLQGMGYLKEVAPMRISVSLDKIHIEDY